MNNTSNHQSSASRLTPRQKLPLSLRTVLVACLLGAASPVVAEQPTVVSISATTPVAMVDTANALLPDLEQSALDDAELDHVRGRNTDLSVSGNKPGNTAVILWDEIKSNKTQQYSQQSSGRHNRQSNRVHYSRH